MNKSFKINRHWIIWLSVSKQEYAIAVYFQHGEIDFEIPNYHYYSIAIAIFGIHLGITYHKYYYEK